jgi:hypothetical protein
LGYNIAVSGICLLTSKVEAIQQLKSPNAQSRLDINIFQLKLNPDPILELLENSNDEIPNIDFSLSTAVIAKHQQKDTALVRHIKCQP